MSDEATAVARLDAVMFRGLNEYDWGMDRDNIRPNDVAALIRFYRSGNLRHAALTMRNPDNFSLLLEAFEASGADTIAGKLDDALKRAAIQERMRER